jgi:hypothetical protein
MNGTEIVLRTMQQTIMGSFCATPGERFATKQMRALTYLDRIDH